MAAGMAQVRVNRFIYRRLKSLQRELRLAFVECSYRQRHFELRDLEHGDEHFTVFFRTLRASNGECAILPHLVITRRGAGSESFDHLDFRRGIERIKDMFQPKLDLSSYKV